MVARSSMQLKELGCRLLPNGCMNRSQTMSALRCISTYHDMDIAAVVEDRHLCSQHPQIPVHIVCTRSCT